MSDSNVELKKTFQVGWNAPGQILQTTDRDEMHKFVDKVVDAGGNPIVINILIEADTPEATVTPIGG